MLVVLREAASAALLPHPLRRHAGGVVRIRADGGTPPNAIVLRQRLRVAAERARTGVLLDLAAAVMGAAWCWCGALVIG